MNPDFAVALVDIEAMIELPDGTNRVADVLLTADDGRKIAIEIAVTNPKDESYPVQMEAIGLPAIEHEVKVTDPDEDIPSAALILAASEWLWEPHSAPLKESMNLRRERDNFLTNETQLQAAARMTQSAAEKARQNAYDTYQELSSIKRIVDATIPIEEAQIADKNLSVKRINKGLCFTHDLVEQAERKPYRDLVASIEPVINTKLRPIERDRFGSPLRRDTKATLNHRAKQIAVLGFKQQSSRPTLFKAKSGKWAVFVDLDSTDVMRIWEVDCEPAIYAFPQDDMGQREMLLTEVGRFLCQAGIPYRRYFMDDGHFYPTTCPICRSSDERSSPEQEELYDVP